MRRIIGLCVMVLILSGCSQKAAFEELADGVCSSEQAQLVQAHISSQIDAMAKKDWELAYSFASPGFRSGVEIEQFIFIIGTQYAMLVENEGYEFSACTIASEKLVQEIAVTSNAAVTNLTYILSVQKEVLGVDSATTSQPKLEA
jgi:fructose-1,6-bisphosphatase/sedoheptulose 1,7-bisphosphatase-like protein